MAITLSGPTKYGTLRRDATKCHPAASIITLIRWLKRDSKYSGGRSIRTGLFVLSILKLFISSEEDI